LENETKEDKPKEVKEVEEQLSQFEEDIIQADAEEFEDIEIEW
jgi:hypothetical protein